MSRLHQKENRNREILFLFVLPFVLAHLWVSLRFQYIVIHHSASKGDNYRSIRRAHWARGWSDAAYHIILNPDSGKIESSWRFKFLAWSPGTRNPKMNVLGLHVCVVGNFEDQTMTEIQNQNLVQTVKGLQKAYDIGDSRIRLHRDCSPTLCPGKNFQKADLITGLGQVKGRSFLTTKFLQMGFVFAIYHLFLWIWRKVQRIKTNDSSG